MNYFPFHIGDYAVHTRHLSLMEDLAYRRLLDVYYTRETPLPVDEGQVARLVGMREQQAEVAAVLAEFFMLTEDGWINQRADDEILKMRAKQENARESVARRQANAADKQASRTHDASVKQASSTNTNTNTNTKEDQEQPPTVVVKRSASDPSRYTVPDCPYDRLLDVYHEALPMLARVVVFNGPRRASLRSRWVEVCAAEKYDTDAGVQWFRDFLWGVRKSKFLTGNSSPSPGRTPFKADLEWLMKPTNFAKVVEGRYHGETA